jgi:purine-binding chemotaxis protein CheW
MKDDAQRYLTFRLSGERYAVPLLATREVIPYVESSPVPYTPAYFKGIINLRGQVISVIDLRLKLRLPEAALTAETAIVILDLQSPLGVIVDSVDSVVSLKPSEITNLPVAETHGTPCGVIGVARKENDLILLLDAAQAVAMEELKGFRKAG